MKHGIHIALSFWLPSVSCLKASKSFKGVPLKTSDKKAARCSFGCC